ncbi:hypothetical protein ALC152_03830 [Arcobacter sp. 15-2]|uniref:phage regulatory CII family protein n=1 Tax=Arcobacter sp. 15-2 TaxID=3374109 RepID=UPI00399D0EB4
MARAFQLIKNQDFIKTLKFSLLQFENEFNITANQHIANKLGFKTSAQFTNLLQPFNEKYMKVDELFLILDNLDTHSKHILDYICHRYGFVCSSKATAENNTIDNTKDLLLSIGGSNGSLFNDFLLSIQDKHLDLEEIENLEKKAYQTRALLNQFEHDLKEKKKAL